MDYFEYAKACLLMHDKSLRRYLIKESVFGYIVKLDSD